MKKGIIFIITFLLCQQRQSYAQASARSNGAYYNTEKYWFYRYRLINDFMKIGSNCGESMPFAERNKDKWKDASGGGGEDLYILSTGGEVPIHLGNYIAALATEYKLLSNNGLSTVRTENELDLAINAFERMDKNAESYTREFFTTPLPATLSCSRQPAEGDFNGYFIREDIPYKTFLIDNLKHFNRSGALTQIRPYPQAPKYWPQELGAALKRLERIRAGSYDPWPTGWKDCVPHEESQDGTVNLAMGFALVNKFVGNPFLSSKASGNLYRMINYPNEGSKIGIIPQWVIRNPVRNDCVYGDDGTNNCFDGGAHFAPVAYGAVKSNNKWGIPSSGLNYDVKNWANIWHLQQKNINHEDLNFWGMYAAISRSWYASPPILTPFGTIDVGKNITWEKMKIFAKKFHEGNPGLPYLYRVLHTGRGEPFMAEQTKIKLDEAPPCGPHNYYGDYSNRKSESGTFVRNGPYAWHWSGPNLLHSYYSRDGWKRHSTHWPWDDGDRDGSGPRNEHVDYNGLDYMALFNMYSLQDFYLLWMFNSYYKENFNLNFPDKVGTGLETGSYHRQLKLNFLEYVSAINKVEPNGYFTMRCGKAIDLKPGFEAKTGSRFLAYIEDYHIDCGSPEGTPSEEYHYAEINQKPGWVFQPQGVMPQSQSDTSYVLDFPPDGVPYIADSAALTNLGEEVPDTLTCEQVVASFDSTVAAIYASGDLDQIAYIDSLIPYITFPECDSTGSGGGTMRKTAFDTSKTNTVADASFNIYPNPSNGHFTFAFAAVGNYDIKIFNALGSVIYQTHVYSRRSEVVHIDGLASGVYTAEVVNSDGLPNKQIRKLIISH